VRADFAWGTLDQVLSSGTNLVLSVAAGRVLGPSGLGVVFIGFSAYLVALGFERALVLNPLVVSDPGGEPASVATSRACTLVIVGAAIAALGLAVIGWAVPGDIGDGLLIMAPWIVPALVQDLWRSVLFRDRRGSAAAVNDGIWAAALVLGAPLLVVADSPAAIVAWWGLGACAGAVAGFVQTRTRPSSLRAAREWWRAHAALGGWLWLHSAVFYATTQGVVLELGAALGARELGGLRAVDALLTPLSLVKPAVELPGLPAVARALRRSRSEASALAMRISLGVAAATAAYVIAVGSVGRHVLTFVFGPAFAGFDRLVVPLGAAQIASALAVGAVIMLKATRRGQALVTRAAAGGVVTLALVGPLAAKSGLVAAGWGLAVGSAVTTVVTVGAARRRGREPVEAPVEPQP
jgi:O-antigen/teichoic acid export membrane protein